jgi:Sec-independent protein translocase protein TatA
MGAELLIGVVLGFVILGPRRMHGMLGTLGRAKAQFDKVSRELKSQFNAEFEGSRGANKKNESLVPDGNGEIESGH